MLTSAYDQYKQQSIVTLTPGEMIVKLYDEAIKRCNFSVKYLDDKDYEAANVCLKKAQDIVSYLNSSLDKNYSLSAELSPLYDYIKNQLITANIKKDTQPINDVLPLLKELRDAFSTAEKSVRKS
ncbi:flagellar export chaperone FliS [Acetanaerobacterium elongatum]|uniref:Flagellar protein FliS n=1 Tax=Acetanaerobacterium elongatum TaxID=258515 RepID=A0A1H0AV81_9FIRM|nr:flagellar export chaperone FliS [Acetanaerobacterium elongatum]SDN37352.1 flagellar protein FliS [Acetanaerobacterium elongatum]